MAGTPRLVRAVLSWQALFVGVLLIVSGVIAWVSGAVVGRPEPGVPQAATPRAMAANRIVTTQQCTIGPYDEPRDVASATVAPNASLQACADSLKRPDGSELVAAFVVGHADKRDLKAALRKVYGDNFGLAYQRALLVKQRIDSQMGGRSLTVALPAAASHVDPSSSADQMAGDRTVTVTSLWLTPVVTDDAGRQATGTRSDLDILALLGIAIALAAYLAALRQNLDSLKVGLETGANATAALTIDKIARIKAMQRSLMVPDALLIVSAIALGVYKIWLPDSLRLLYFGKIVFTSAAIVLVVYHLQQWARHLGKR